MLKQITQNQRIVSFLWYCDLENFAMEMVEYVFVRFPASAFGYLF